MNVSREIAFRFRLSIKISESDVCIRESEKKTVPQTDTGGQVEYTKALERTMLKELGKLHL